MSSIMPLPNEAVGAVPLPFVSGLPLEVATEDSDISDARELELALDQNDALPRSRLAAMTNRLVTGTLAFVQDIVFLYRVLRHPNTPWYAKGMLFLPVMYLCSPIQLIPNFIPVIGQMDDVFVIWVAKKLAVKFVDTDTRRECQDAAAAIKFLQRLRPTIA